MEQENIRRDNKENAKKSCGGYFVKAMAAILIACLSVFVLTPLMGTKAYAAPGEPHNVENWEELETAVANGGDITITKDLIADSEIEVKSDVSIKGSNVTIYRKDGEKFDSMFNVNGGTLTLGDGVTLSGFVKTWTENNNCSDERLFFALQLDPDSDSDDAGKYISIDENASHWILTDEPKEWTKVYEHDLGSDGDFELRYGQYWLVSHWNSSNVNMTYNNKKTDGYGDWGNSDASTAAKITGDNYLNVKDHGILYWNGKNVVNPKGETGNGPAVKLVSIDPGCSEAEGSYSDPKVHHYRSDEISDNIGFFVTVNGGTFNLTGSKLTDFISNNDVKNVAPVYVNGGTFTMNSGSIENNTVGYTAEDSKAGEHADAIQNYLKEWTITDTAGAVILDKGATGEINGGTIINNSGDTGAIAVWGAAPSEGKKEGDKTTLKITGDAKINCNTGVHHAGAIYVYNGGTLAMDSGEIAHNFAWNKGGAIWVSEEVYDSTKWMQEGSTEYVSDASFEMTGGTITHNAAVNRAGAIEVASNHVSLLKGTLSYNYSRSLGGAIYVEGDNRDHMYQLYIDKGQIRNNTATNDSGVNEALYKLNSESDENDGCADCKNPRNLLSEDESSTADYNDYYGYQGYGGGVWLCSFGGNATIDASDNVIINNNAAATSGQDLKLRPAAQNSGSAVNIMAADETKTGSVSSWKNENNNQNVVLGQSYTGPLPITNDDKSSKEEDGVQIYGNVSRVGGGIAANGTVVFGVDDVELFRIRTKFDITKSWSEAPESGTVAKFTISIKDNDGNKLEDDYEVELNGTADTEENISTENKAIYESAPWVATMGLPLTITLNDGSVVPVFTFEYSGDYNGTTIDRTGSNALNPSNIQDQKILFELVREGKISAQNAKLGEWKLSIEETVSGTSNTYELTEDNVTVTETEAKEVRKTDITDQGGNKIATITENEILFTFGQAVHNKKNDEETDTPVNVTIIKHDSDNKETLISGAVLEIIAENGEVIKTITTDGNEKEIYLDPGTYILHEASAPAGYKLAEDKEFTVGEKTTVVSTISSLPDGEVIVYGDGQGVNNYLITEKGQIPAYCISVRKTDPSVAGQSYTSEDISNLSSVASDKALYSGQQLNAALRRVLYAGYGSDACQYGSGLSAARFQDATGLAVSYFTNYYDGLNNQTLGATIDYGYISSSDRAYANVVKKLVEYGKNTQAEVPEAFEMKLYVSQDSNVQPVISGGTKEEITNEETDDKMLIVYMSDEKEETHEEKGNVKIKKLDDGRKILKGAQLKIVEKDNIENIVWKTTDDGFSGEETLELPVGDYLLYETAAPAGYKLNDEYANGVPITIKKDEIVTTTTASKYLGERIYDNNQVIPGTSAIVVYDEDNAAHLAACVNPQYLEPEQGKVGYTSIIDTQLTNSEVQLDNNKLTKEKLEGLKRLLWAGYGHDGVGLKEKLDFTSKNFGNAGFYFATWVAVESYTGETNYKLFDDAQTKGNMAQLRDALLKIAEEGEYDGIKVEVPENYHLKFYICDGTYNGETSEDNYQNLVDIELVEETTEVIKSETPEIELINYGITKTETPVSVQITATKGLEGADIDADEYKEAFEFELKDKDGNVIQTKRNNGGEVSFDAIELNAAGDYEYTVSEIKGDLPNITYSEEVKTVKFTVEEVEETSDDVINKKLVIKNVESEEAPTTEATEDSEAVLEEYDSNVIAAGYIGNKYEEPEIGTKATDNKDNDKILEAAEKVEVKDVVTYKNLTVGKTYTLTGKLVTKSSKGETVVATNETTFTPDSKDGKTELVFIVDSSALAGEKFVAFETVTFEGKEIAIHADINDAAQTVTVEKPGEKTVKISKTTLGGDEIAGAQIELKDEKGEVVETWVSKTEAHDLSLEPGKYTFKETVAPEGFKAVTTEITFTVDKDGKVTLETASVDNGAELEVLDTNHIVLKDAPEKEPEIEKYVNKDVHSDITLDEVFTYDVLAYITADADAATITDELAEDLQFVSAAADVKVTDLGKEVDHTPNGSVAAAGKAVKGAASAIEGRKLTVSIADAKALRGHWVKVTFDAKIADGKTVADLKNATITENTPVLSDEEHTGVPNKASYEITVGNEGKYSDESNTVTVTPEEPEIGTKATDNKDNDKILEAAEKVEVKDVVTYKNLTVGKTYTLTGKLVTKSSKGETVVATNETTFTPDSKDGKTELVFTLNSSALVGEKLVAFETVTFEGKEIAIHADINDAAQTVTVEKPGEKTVKISKTTLGGDEIAGAQIELKDEKGEVAETWVSKTEAHDLSLEPGRYTFKETVAPEGFKAVTTEITFTIDKDGKVTLETASVDNGAELEVLDTNHIVLKDAPEKEPEIEKYVNKDVHSDITLDEVFTYDVLAYITADADAATITDELVEDLQFVSAAADVKVTDLGKEVDHTPNGSVAAAGKAVKGAASAIEGRKLTVSIADAKALRGHWVKVTFDAKIADGKTVADLKNATITENTPVLSDEEHTGVPNKASYEITVGNEGKYSDESNTVTVTPEEPEIGTKATDNKDNDKILEAAEKVEVKDVVTYKNLTVGKTYTLTGKLVTKSSKGETVVATNETTFTPDSKDGKTELVFTVDSSALAGEKLVAFETVTFEGKEIAIHADINDAAQTVTVEKPGEKTVKISKTTLGGDEIAGAQIELKDEKGEVVETWVSKTEAHDLSLEPGRYTFKETVAPEGFKAVTTEITFTIDKDGKVTLETASVDNGAELEVLDTNHIVLKDAPEKEPEIEKYVNKDVHSDITLDEVFTYDVLAYITADADAATITDELAEDLQFVSAAADVKVTDLGKEVDHTPNGSVAAAGKAVKGAASAIEGRKLTVSIADAKALRGHWVKVTFDAKIADGKTVADLKNATITENTPVLSDEEHTGVPNKASYEITIGNEGKYSDESNTVTVTPEEPEIGTKATDNKDNDKILEAAEKVEVKDVVTYKNLTVGKTYTLTGKLVTKSSNGETVVATNETTFTPDSKDGKTELVFTVDSSALAGEKLVAFETVTFEGKEIAIHADINDAAQTVTVEKPGEKTVKISKTTLGGDEIAGAQIELKDEKGEVVETWVSKTEAHDLSLEPGKYTFKETVAPEGFKAVTTEITFTIDKDGKVTLETASVDNGAELEVLDTNHIVLKDAPEKEPEIEKYVNKNVHSDITLDEVFTYDVLAYITADADAATITDELAEDLQFVSAAADVKVTDLGKEVDHTPNGSVATAGKAVKGAASAIEGRKLTVSIADAKALRGHWVKVTFDAKIADGKTVADLKNATITENTPVLSDEEHTGVPNKASYEITVGNEGKYSDESNTVTVTPEEPEIGTKATDNKDNDKILEAAEKVEVKDVVTYKNLTVGKTYTLTGKLVTKSSNGETVVATNETTFTPDSKDGKTELVFTVDSSALAGEKLVAFETVTFEGKEIAIHADINDAAQTVTVEKPGEKTVKISKTTLGGDEIAGAQIELKDEKGEVVETWVSKTEAHDLSLEPGKYTFKETVAPEGFKAVTTEITFTVDKDGKVTLETASVDNGAELEVLDTNHIVLKDAPEKEPEIEKYVNKNVHSDITLDEVFTYDVLAYITADADAATITDELAEDLQFVSAAADVKVTDLGKEVDHTPNGSVAAAGKAVKGAASAIEGRKLTVSIADAKALRGHWVKVTFDAKIADGKTVADLKNATITENTPVLSDEEHTGVPNKASYEITVGNEGKYSDESNTVTVTPEEPEIGTKATDNKDNDKILEAAEKVEVKDVVTYKNLTAGKTYTLTGKLVTKSSNGETVVATNETTFTPDSKDGKTELVFTVDSSALAGEKLVAFETVTFEGKEIAIHADINDAAQTVTVEKPGEKTVKISKADLDGTELPGAKIKVTGNDFEEEWISSNESHDLSLKPGTYTLVEEVSPEGFKTVTTVIEFTVAEDGKVSVKTTQVENGKVAVREDGTLVLFDEPEDEIPEIEKYINQAVHKEIKLDETFTYDILAYVTKDADDVTVTDILNENLAFAGAAEDVKVADLGENDNHKVTNDIAAAKVNDDATVALAGTPAANAQAAIDGQTLTVKIDDAATLRGHWIKVTFTAKIADGKTIADLKYANVKTNTPVISDEEHTGVPNTASYNIGVKNIRLNEDGTPVLDENGKPVKEDKTTLKYEDESNTVTVKPEDVPYIVNISKADLDGTEVPGAKIKVTGNDFEEEWISDTESHELTLKPGTYTLVEEVAPAGYKKVTTTIEFEVTNEGTAKLLTTEVENGKVGFNEDGTLILFDEPEDTTKDVKISKVDIAGNEIEGAQIQIRQGEAVVESWTSTKEIHEIKLNPGTYVFHEEAAPHGYTAVTDVVFLVDENGNVKVETVDANYALVDENGVLVITDDFAPHNVSISKADLDGTEVPGAVITVTGNDFTETWVSTDKSHNLILKPGSYTLVEEVAPAGFKKVTTTIEFLVDFEGNVNVLTQAVENGKVALKEDGTLVLFDEPEDIVYTEIPVSKTWVGREADEAAPESVTVRLLADGVEKANAQLTETNGWAYTFTNLEKFADGKEIIYTITEDAIDNYTSEISGYDVTNTYTPGNTSVNVVKAWTGDNEAKRPASVIVDLLADGVKIDSKELTAQDNWSATFAELPVLNEAGERISYTVSEQPVEGYAGSVTGSSDKGYVINNERIRIDTHISKQAVGGGSELEGATLIVADSDGNEVERWISGTSEHIVEALPTGIYTLTEITAPKGYEIAETITFRVNDDGSIDVSVNGNWTDAQGLVVMYDAPAEGEKILEHLDIPEIPDDKPETPKPEVKEETEVTPVPETHIPETPEKTDDNVKTTPEPEVIEKKDEAPQEIVKETPTPSKEVKKDTPEVKQPEIPVTTRRTVNTPVVVTPSGSKTGTTVSKATATGDSNSLTIWIVMAASAAAAIAAAGAVIARKRRED